MRVSCVPATCTDLIHRIVACGVPLQLVKKVQVLLRRRNLPLQSEVGEERSGRKRESERRPLRMGTYSTIRTLHCIALRMHFRCTGAPQHTTTPDPCHLEAVPTKPATIAPSIKITSAYYNLQAAVRRATWAVNKKSRAAPCRIQHHSKYREPQ